MAAFQLWSLHDGMLGHFLKTTPLPLGNGLLLFVLGAIPLSVLEGVRLARLD